MYLSRLNLTRLGLGPPPRASTTLFTRGLQIPDLTVTGAAILNFAAVDHGGGLAWVPAVADLVFPPEVDEGDVEAVNVCGQNAEDKKDAVDGQVPAQTAEEVDA